MSFKKYLSKITEYYYKNITKIPETVYDFPEVFRKSKKLLIILPNEVDKRKKLLSKIHFVQTELKMLEIKFAGIDLSESEIKKLPKSSLSISLENINLMSVPSDSVLSRISKEAYDLSLDMNSEFDLSSAICGLKAGIPLRFGFSHGYGTPFYNVGFWGHSIEDFIRFWKEVNRELRT